MRRCSECDAQVEDTTEQEVFSLGGRTFESAIPAERCQRGHVVIDGSARERFMHTVAEQLVADGPVCGEAFRFVRETLGQDAAQIASFLEVTPETISRWEDGSVVTPVSAWDALTSLVMCADGSRATRNGAR
jgi:DNA-binding transcriptional regulator YiaG